MMHYGLAFYLDCDDCCCVVIDYLLYCTHLYMLVYYETYSNLEHMNLCN